MRKRIYKAMAVLLISAMVLCDNSIVSLAAEILPEETEIVYEEVIGEEPVAQTEIEEESDNEAQAEIEEESDNEEQAEIEEESEIEEQAEIEEELILGADVVKSGKSNDVSWEIDSNGKLTISGTGDWSRTGTTWTNTPWEDYKDDITSAKVELSDVTDLSYMFLDCSNLIKIETDSSFKLQSAISTKGMFKGCKKLTDLDTSNYSPTRVLTMQGMFADCSSLTKLDLGDFHPEKVIDVSDMFNGCTNLREVDLSSFFLLNVKSGTFAIPENSDTSDESFGMRNMFKNCESLKVLDMSVAKISDGVDTTDIFVGCDSLKKIITPTECESEIVLPTNTSWLDADSNNYYVFPKTSKTLTTADCSDIGVSNNVWWEISESGVLTVGGTGDWERDEDGCPPWHEYCNEISAAEVNLTGTTDASFMFRECSNLVSVDLSNFDTSNVTNMKSMFDDCKGLKELDLTTMNTAKVIDMTYMFYCCSSVCSIDMSSFVISDSIFDIEIFTGCENLGRIVTPASCNAQVKLPMGSWTDEDYNILQFLPETSKTITLAQVLDYGAVNTVNWFVDTNGTLVVSGIGDWGGELPPWNKYCDVIECAKVNLSFPLNLGYMFYQCENLTSVDLSNLDTSDVTNMSEMFSGCKSLTSLDLSGVDTSNVTNMSDMFLGCESLTSLDLSGFNTSKVTNMAEMFCCCESLTSLNLNGFDTSNVEDMNCMFSSCRSIKELDVSKFKTSNVTNMAEMFGGCESLTSLDLSGFDTTKVVDMSGMFEWCGVSELNLDTFDTSKVTNMSCMFTGCNNIVFLDLSGFDTSKVSDMTLMFDACTNLIKLDISSFDMRGAKGKTDQMFWYCSKLGQIVTPKFCDSKVELPDEQDLFDTEGNLYTELPETSLFLRTADYKDVFIITYLLNGGVNNNQNPSLYKKNKKVTLKNPKKEGYTFDGWFDKATDEKVSVIKGKDITVIAKWTVNNYTVTFNGNGGNYTPDGAKKATATKKQSFTYDESKALEANVFARKGYTFTGWNTKKDGKGTAYKDGAEVLNLTKTNNGNVNLYAQWSANEYTINFDINAEEIHYQDQDGNMATVTGKYAKALKLPANNFTKKGYSFKGWSTDKDATKAQYKNKASVKNLAIEDGAEVTLYAVWSVNTYNVKFVANGGNGKSFKKTGFKYGENPITWPENIFTNKELYTFGGWVVDNTVYPVDQVNDLIATKNNQTFTAYAAWLYEFEIYMGKETETKRIEGCIYNCPISIEEFEDYLPELAKPGYYLAGFATSKKNADKGKCAYTKSVKNVAGKTLYPVYKPIKYTVKFDKNAPEGAKVTGKMSNVSATYGKSFTLKANAFKCSGRTFLGWSTDKDAKEPEFTNKAKIEESLSVTNKDVVTLYAIWQDK